jgi:hypothetical protein
MRVEGYFLVEDASVTPRGRLWLRGTREEAEHYCELRQETERARGNAYCEMAICSERSADNRPERWASAFDEISGWEQGAR